MSMPITIRGLPEVFVPLEALALAAERQPSQRASGWRVVSQVGYRAKGRIGGEGFTVWEHGKAVVELRRGTCSAPPTGRPWVTFPSRQDRVRYQRWVAAGARIPPGDDTWYQWPKIATSTWDTGRHRCAPYQKGTVGYAAWFAGTVYGLDLGNLPSDPAALRARFLKAFAAAQPQARRDQLRSTPDVRIAQEEAVIWKGMQFALSTPATTPKGRAAIFRMLARFTTARVVNDARDPLGRRGIGISLSLGYDPKPVPLVMIFDRDTSRLLGTWYGATASPNAAAGSSYVAYQRLEPLTGAR
jgi:hypothetical protein